MVVKKYVIGDSSARAFLIAADCDFSDCRDKKKQGCSELYTGIGCFDKR